MIPIRSVAARFRGRLVELVRERLLNDAGNVDVTEGDVGVAVEQAGQHGPPADVDGLVAVEAGADVDDAAVLDRDVAIGRVGARPVKDAAPANDNPAHLSPPIRSTAARNSSGPSAAVIR